MECSRSHTEISHSILKAISAHGFKEKLFKISHFPSERMTETMEEGLTASACYDQGAYILRFMYPYLVNSLSIDRLLHTRVC